MLHLYLVLSLTHHKRRFFDRRRRFAAVLTSALPVSLDQTEQLQRSQPDHPLPNLQTMQAATNFGEGLSVLDSRPSSRHTSPPFDESLSSSVSLARLLPCCGI